MGSSDSSCCGPQNCPVLPETDTTLLKQNRRLNQLTTSDTMEYHYYDNDHHQCLLKSTSSSSPMPPQVDTESKSISSSPMPPQSNGKIIHNKKKKRRKYNKISTQIEILCSENARAQSLLLCSKPENIQRDGIAKDFGFLKYLETNLSEKSVSELFSKFPSKNNEGDDGEHTLGTSQFVKILTLTTIIYKVKLFHLKTGTKDKPDVDSDKIKTAVEHAAVWVIRKYGEKLNVKKSITVHDDQDNEIKGQYDVYKFRITQKRFFDNVYKWLQSYVDEDGHYPL